MKKYTILLMSLILLLALAACSDPAVDNTHQHSYARNVVAATCTAAGYTAYTCDCGDSYFQQLVEATGHSYTDTVVPPTADGEGYTEHLCTVCNHSYQDNRLPQLDTSHQHSYKADKVVSADCTSIGYTVYTCNCGDSHMKDVTPAAGHSYQKTVIEPTQGVQGYTEYACSVCGYSFRDDFVEALPNPHRHLYSAVKNKAATCVAEGYTVYRCECGEEIKGSYTGFSDHEYFPVVYPATHTREGYTDYQCKYCDESYIGDFVPCTPEHEYVLDVFEPECMVDGFTHYLCACGSSFYDDIVPALGHSYSPFGIVRPTCETEGYTVHVCANCGHERFEVAEEPLGHNYQASQVIEPTADEKGYTVYVCSNCNDSYHGDFVDPTEPEDPNKHVCSGDYHVELQVGPYLYVYCDTVESPYKSEDGYTIYYPYEYYF